MSFCMFCGNELKEGATFCGHCGSPVNSGVNQVNVYNHEMNATGQAAAVGKVMEERSKALDIVSRATAHFAPYQAVFEEYYQLLSTKWVRLVRHTVALLIPAAIATIAAALSTINGISIMRNGGGGRPGVFVLYLIIAVGLWAGEIFRHMHKQSERTKVKARIIEIDRLLMDAYEKCPVKEYFAPAYALPQLMDQVGKMIDSGKANSFEEGIYAVNHSLVSIFKSATDSTLRHALTSRTYKNHSDLIKNENGFNAVHFVLEQTV